MRYSGYRTTLLAALDVAQSVERMRFLEAWSIAEGGTARFNAWNTTYSLSGSSNYNHVGVKNYADALMGNAASLLTIRLAPYASLRTALRAPGLTAEEITRAAAQALTVWGTGTAGILAVLAREH